MNMINPTTATQTPSTKTSSIGAASAMAKAGGLTQADFLKLMTTQLKAQDPTNPVDNSQFVSQMAQFSQLQSSQDLLTSVNSLSSSIGSALQTSQVLNSSNLVNRQVLVPSSTLNYSGATVNGGANVTASGDVEVNILDAHGNVVRTMDLGSQNAGLSSFSWDGKDNSGVTVAAGTYTMAASTQGSSLDTYATGKVTAVGDGGGNLGTYLQVAGVGGVPLSAVAQIQ